VISGSLDRRAKVFACGSSPGHPGSAQMRSVRMSTVGLGNLDFGRFAGARPRAAPRGPPAPRDHGLCSPRPWRARLAVRETSEGMNLPRSLRRSPGAIQWIVIR